MNNIKFIVGGGALFLIVHENKLIISYSTSPTDRLDLNEEANLFEFLNQNNNTLITPNTLIDNITAQLNNTLRELQY